MKKLIRRITIRLLIILVVAYLYWPIAAMFLFTGCYDVLRQKNKNKSFLFYQYFLVNGALTWLFSPLNTLIDILCLPYFNKQIYKLHELPEQHQKEIKTIIEQCPKKELVNLIDNIQLTTKRSMLLYKWYGFNIENRYSCPLFHQNFKQILTIGISAFNKQTKTTQHFGWLRAGIRVLINIDENLDPGAYIDVNNQRHVWCTDGPIFIFDDTVLHQSFNLTDKNRNCLFIDIVRPSLIPVLISSFVKFLGWLSISFPSISKTSRWKITR